MSLSRRIKRRQQAQFNPKASAKSQAKRVISKIDPQMLKKLEKASKDLERVIKEEPLTTEAKLMLAEMVRARPDILDTLNTLSTNEILSLLDPHDQLRVLLVDSIKEPSEAPLPIELPVPE